MDNLSKYINDVSGIATLLGIFLTLMIALPFPKYLTPISEFLSSNIVHSLFSYILLSLNVFIVISSIFFIVVFMRKQPRRGWESAFANLIIWLSILFTYLYKVISIQKQAGTATVIAFLVSIVLVMSVLFVIVNRNRIRIRGAEMVLNFINKWKWIALFTIIAVIIGGFAVIGLGYGAELGSYIAGVFGSLVVAFVMLIYQKTILEMD